MSDLSCNIPTTIINTEGEVGIYNKKMTYEQVKNDADDACHSAYHGGEQSASERLMRAADGMRAFDSGVANLTGVGDMVYKGMSTAMGGSPNYIDAPTELIKQMKDKLREARDNAFYHSICNIQKLDYEMLKYVRILDQVISEEMVELEDLLDFEVKSLGGLELTISTMLITIIIYMLLLEPPR